MEPSSPTARFRTEALRHWVGLGLDGAAERLSGLVGCPLRLELGNPVRDPGVGGWMQRLDGPFRAQVWLVMDAGWSERWLSALAHAGNGSLEPSPELGDEAANVLLNGVIMSLGRGLATRLCSSLPQRSASCHREDSFYWSMAWSWPEDQGTAGLCFSVHPEDRSDFERCLNRSMARFMESLAWSA